MNATAGPAWQRSVRWRLLLATPAGLLVALVLAGLLLAGLFRDHVQRQAVAMLTAQLDQVIARLEFDADGRPEIDPAALSDPRWLRPRSGLYWQVESEGGSARAGLLRSRSLWDATLRLPDDALADGALHVHTVAGLQGEPLLAVERTVRQGGEGAAFGARWRVVVAADLTDLQAAMQRFNGVLAASLAALGALLGAATWLQLAVGLAPLRALQRAVAEVREGRAPQLQGRLPSEVQPLVDDFNAVLARNAEVVARARTQAGDLAHAIKTPLAALRQAAAAAGRGGAALAELPPLVQEQVGVAQRQVDWHLARSRAAAARGLPGARVPAAPVLADLRRVMEKVHAARGLRIDVSPVDAGCAFAGEVEDLQEIVGNVLDNACKWARHEVRLAARTEHSPAGMRLEITVEDDGPGIAAAKRSRLPARGMRLDESVPGSGLGLSIARELVTLYGGTLELLGEPPAGLQVRIRLPGR